MPDEKVAKYAASGEIKKLRNPDVKIEDARLKRRH